MALDRILTRGSSSTRVTTLRSALIARMVAIGLVIIVVSLALLGLQIRRTAREEAQGDAARRAAASATALEELFTTWREQLLIAASNSAYTDWYARPQERARLRTEVDRSLEAVYRIYPTLIDEACFLDAHGAELARMVHGEPAPTSALSADESDADFFAPALRQPDGTAYQSRPYLSEDSKRWVVGNLTPLQVSGQTKALLHFEANLDAVRALLAEQLPAGALARIVDTETGLTIADTSESSAIQSGALAAAGTWRTPEGYLRASAVLDLGASNANHWTVEISRPPAQPFTGGLVGEAALLLAGASALLVGVAVRLGNGISRPVVRVTEVAEALAAGDLTQRADTGRSDEIGRMATALDQAMARMAEQREDLSRELSARQELRQRAEDQRIRDEREIRSRAQKVIDSTAAAVASQLRTVDDHTRQVQDGAATIDERVDVAGRSTRALVDQAEHARRLVGSLTENLHTVGGIADFIAKVASQTDLLALNATIEAARAGAAGRGFSVVAEEVKSLATETARSTKEITSTIAVLEQNARAVADAIAAIAGSVSGIDEATSDVTTVTALQTQVTAELGETVRQAIGCIAGLSDVAEQLERASAEGADPR